MEIKKNPRADLRNRKVLFFETGLILALMALIVVFSTGQKEKIVSLSYTQGVVEDFELPDLIKKEEVKTKAVAKRVVLDPTTLIVKDNKDEIFVHPSFAEFEENIEIPVERYEPEVVDDFVYDAEVMPSFMGGDLKTFHGWVSQRLRYPSQAIETGIAGKVVLQFIVEKDGSISNITVLIAPDQILADEAIRVVSQSPQWSPGFMGTRAVRLKYTLPIDFKISN